MTATPGQTELADQALNGWQTLSSAQNTEDYLEHRREARSIQLFLNLLPTVVFIGVQAAVGVSGNLLIICVYLKQFRSSSAKVFILAMAVCDLLTNVVSSPLAIIHTRRIYNNVDNVGCKAMKAALRFPTIMSVCLLVCVAFDRRRRICFPLRRQMTARHAGCTLLLSIALSALLTSPYVILPGEINDGFSRQCDIQSKYHQGNENFAIVLMVHYGMVLASLGACYIHIAWKACQLKWNRQRNWESKGPIVYPGQKSNLNKSSSVSAERTELNNIQKSVYSPDHQINNPIDKVTATYQFSPRSELDKQDFEASSRSACNKLLTPNKMSVAICPTESTTDELSISNDSILFSNTGAASVPESYSIQPDKTEQFFAEAKTESKTSVNEQAKHQKIFFSKTTLMMFVLTITTIVFFVPHIVLGILGDGCFKHEENILKMNSCYVALVFPYLNSVINPFIYSFCNPKFRLHCRQVLCNLCHWKLC